MARDFKKKIMVIAGEPSGDLHGANLIKAIVHKEAVDFYGIGGPAMEKAGVELLYHIKDLSVMGLTEVFSKLPHIFKARRSAKKALKFRRPDLLILIDFPDFNLMVAKAAKSFGIPVLYYISPKIWASRSGRAKKIKKRISHMAIILPFEKEFFERYDIPVTYVGHPLLDTPLLDCRPSRTEESSRQKVIGLLPGSRVSEVTRLLPVMMEAAEKLNDKNQGYRFLVSLAPSIDPELVHNLVFLHRNRMEVEIVAGDIGHVFERAGFLVAASGTVTLEAAIYEIPMVVIYKMSFFSHFMAKMLIELEHISLVNLIVGRCVVPELIQEKANSETLADTISGILDDPKRLNQMKSDLNYVKNLLGEPGASKRVADLALKMIEK